MSPAAPLHFRYSLDTPLPVRAVEGVVRLKGWCFAEAGSAGLQIQLRIDQFTLTCLAADSRADVAAAFPDIPHAGSSGFEFSGHVPAGLLAAELWAGRDGFGWNRLISFSIYGEAAVLHGAIDLPLEKEILSNLTVDGWCFHPQREIAELWLHYGTSRVRCRHYGHERKDVGRQFPHLPQARSSGFSSEAVLTPGEGRVRLRAVDREGGEYYCETDHFVRFQPALSIHAANDSRLDGRALFQAFSSRQASLPALRIITTSTAFRSLSRICSALGSLPGDNWSIVVLSEASPPPELRNLARENARIVFAAAWSPNPEAWDLRLGTEELPDVHGLLATWLVAGDHPGHGAIVGDFTEGEARMVRRQPPWSRALALSGGIQASAPVLTSGAIALDSSVPPVVFLATIGAAVVHVPAVLIHRTEGIVADFPLLHSWLQKSHPLSVVSFSGTPRRTTFTPSLAFQRPTVTAVVIGDDASIPSLKTAFGNEVDQWIVTPSFALLNQAIEKATSTLLFFLNPDCRPVSTLPVTTLALHLASFPGAAVAPLLIHDNFSPWSGHDFFPPHLLEVLENFDPAFRHWSDRTQTLFTRQIPYLALPGLLIARTRLDELGGFNLKFESATGALLDLAFNLRAAGTPPLLCTETRLTAQARPIFSSFEETLLLDRWDRDDANPLRIRPLVPTESLR